MPGVAGISETKGTAHFSRCERYRYALTRTWDRTLPSVLFVGLNPSTADATRDDATVRRCTTFARDWGFGSVALVNLFAFRSTDPSLLPHEDDPVGPANDEWINRLAAESGQVIIAWGIHGALLQRDQQVLQLIEEPFCLGKTKNGSPRHPLYLRRTALPRPYS